MAGRRAIRRRKRFFVGCEGQSEQGYAKLIQQIADEEGLAVHIDAKILVKAGDPLAMTKRAVAEIAFGEQSPRSVYSHRFLLFDTDRLGQSPARDIKIKRLASQNELTLVQQDICFESVLLRHFSDHETDNPMTSANALSRLAKIWPDYRKGASAMELGRKIGPSDIRRAAKSNLNSDLAVFLDKLGMM